MGFECEIGGGGGEKEGAFKIVRKHDLLFLVVLGKITLMGTTHLFLYF